MSGGELARTLRGVAAACGLGALASACASLPAPYHWPPLPEVAPQDPRGAWTNVRIRQNDEKVNVSGELLAVHDDSVYVSTPLEAVHPIPWSSIDRVQVVGFDPQAGAAY